MAEGMRTWEMGTCEGVGFLRDDGRAPGGPILKVATSVIVPIFVPCLHILGPHTQA